MDLSILVILFFFLIPNHPVVSFLLVAISCFELIFARLFKLELVNLMGGFICNSCDCELDCTIEFPLETADTFGKLLDKLNVFL